MTCTILVKKPAHRKQEQELEKTMMKRTRIAFIAVAAICLLLVFMQGVGATSIKLDPSARDRAHPPDELPGVGATSIKSGSSGNKPGGHDCVGCICTYGICIG